MLEAHVTPSGDFSSELEIERFLRAVEIHKPKLENLIPIYPTVIYDMATCGNVEGKLVCTGDNDVFLTTHLANSNSSRLVFSVLRPLFDFLHKVKASPLRIKIKSGPNFVAGDDWPVPYWEAHCEINVEREAIGFADMINRLPRAHYSYNRLKPSGPWIASFRGKTREEIMQYIARYESCSRVWCGDLLNVQVEQVLFDNNFSHDSHWKYFGEPVFA